jgi:addiction module HigA family antidote
VQAYKVPLDSSVYLVVGPDIGTAMMAMNYPVHPGRIIRESIDDLGLTEVDAADGLNVSRSTLSNLLNGRSGVSSERAERLSQMIGSTPEFWMRLQVTYDRSQAQSET